MVIILALDEDFSVFIGRAGDTPENVYEVNVEIPNEPVMGRILVEKKGLQFTGVQRTTDAYGNEVQQPVYEERYLAGATFEVRAADDIVGGDGTIWYRQGDLADTITTTGSGADASKALPLGKYVLVETVTPAGYVPDDTLHAVELAFMDNRTPLVEARVSVDNAYLPAEITLTKEKEVLQTQISDDSVYREIVTMPAEGFVFGLMADEDLYDEGVAIMSGSLVATGVTDAQGRLTFSGCFPHGQYVLRELYAPEGWVMGTQAYPVTLAPDAREAGASVIRVTLDEPIRNDLVYHTVTLTKTNITGEQTVPSAQIEVRDEAGNVIYLAETDENGEIPEIPVTPGRYTFRETLAPEGYALNTAEMTFEVDAAGRVSGNTVIRDDYTRVSVLKQDESGETMAGVEFSLVDAYGQTRMTAVSDIHGLATFERVPYGRYAIVETRALPGYFRSGVTVELTVDGSFVNPKEPLATIVNHPMRIECIKVDTSGRYLPGVEFSLIDASTDTVVEIVTSDEQGRFAFDAIDYGDWVIRETRAPEGYRTMEDVHLTIGEDFVQPEPITFTNVPNHYEFMKVNEQHEPLAGVTFVLEDDAGHVLRELVSGDDGIVHVDHLDFGRYVIRETQALEGYQLTEETISLTIDENYVDPSELYCLVNEREPITAIIQTGVTLAMTPVTWLGVGLLVCGALVLGARRRGRNRNENMTRK